MTRAFPWLELDDDRKTTLPMGKMVSWFIGTGEILVDSLMGVMHDVIWKVLNIRRTVVIGYRGRIQGSKQLRSNGSIVASLMLTILFF